MGLLTLLKGLPLTYNRDLQEDKEGFFDTVDTLLATLEVFAGMIGTMEVSQERAAQAAKDGYMLATDLADYLVGKGEPFRAAHGIVAELTRYAASQGKGLEEMDMSEYKRFSPHFDEDVYAISAETSIAARDVKGGTGPRPGGRRNQAGQKSFWRRPLTERQPVKLAPSILSADFRAAGASRWRRPPAPAQT